MTTLSGALFVDLRRRGLRAARGFAHVLLLVRTRDACKGSFVLAPRDALVIVGCSPPEAQYFSVQVRRRSGARPVSTRMLV
jgi:hypothetical protein